MERVRTEPGNALWLQWTLVTVGSSIPAVTVGWYIYDLMRSVWVPFPGLLLGAIATWTLVAFAQTFVLKRYMPGMPRWEWIAANAAGAGVAGWPLIIYASGPPFLMSSSASACVGGIWWGFFCGLIVGVAQWVVLSGQEHNVGAWVGISPFSAAIGSTIGLLVAWQYLPEYFAPETLLPVLSCLTGLFAVNAPLTGFALVRMLR